MCEVAASAARPCAPSPVPHAPDLSGCALDGRYELHAIIGEGAFGRVYRGRDRRLDRAVAVKVIKPWWTEDPEWSENFERETQLLARLDDPGIVRIFDVGHAPEGLYFVSELVDGEDLSARLRRGALAPIQACGVAAGICRALARAHAGRIIHRDVKPANILLTRDGAVKVGDFGVARLAESSTDGTASIVGTPRYMAPEQGRGRPTTPATDVYSVGIVLYEMLAGHTPFPGGTVVELALAHLNDMPPPLPGAIPGELVAVVQRAVAKDPADRFADAADMADALEDVRGAISMSRRPRPLARRQTRTRSAALVSVGGGSVPPATSPRRSRDGSGGGDQARRIRPPAAVDRTQIAPVLSLRRTLNPPARRRATAALGLVLALLVAMAAGAALLATSARTRVPPLRGLRSGAARRSLREAHLTLRTRLAYSDAVASGAVMTQQPQPGSLVADRSRVTVVVSRGPAPVTAPSVTGDTLPDALRSLRSLGLKTTEHEVAAPGTAPGTVITQVPAARRPVPARSTVALGVAEVPTWRTVSTFSAPSSGPVAIRGRRWRLRYEMAFRGPCTWILFCSGPTARVVTVPDGRVVARFGLSDGGEQTETFASGPGTYDVQIAPGADNAGWSITVQDLF
jgi:hypothetical protein